MPIRLLEQEFHDLRTSYFHILVDLKNSDLQKNITDTITEMSLPNVTISFHASPGKGYYFPIPCNLLLFNSDTAVYGHAHYKNKHLALFPDANFINIGKKFYYFADIDVLEIPEDRYEKYLSRCLMNLYIEFNRMRISELLKDSIGKKT